MIHKFFIYLTAISLAIAACEDKNDDNNTGDNNTSTDNKPANDTIELVTPNGGEEFHVGDTVSVEFKVNAEIISSTEVKVVIYNPPNPREKYNILEGSVESDANNTGLKYARIKVKWIVGEEYEHWMMEEDGNDYSPNGTESKIWLHEYSGPIENSDDSDSSFTVYGE